MSKLIDTYTYLKKKEDPALPKLYLFKSGIFFLLLQEDAKIVHNLLGLKLTNLTENIVKCGFPVSSLEKYERLLKLTGYPFEIIDLSSNISYDISHYTINTSIKKFLKEFSSLDINSLSVKEAYELINTMKEKASNLMEVMDE